MGHYRPSDRGIVYFLHAPALGAVKIGFTGMPSVEARMLSIRAERRCHVTLLATVDGCLADETREHERFAHLWICSEWFFDVSEILDYARGLEGRAAFSIPYRGRRTPMPLRICREKYYGGRLWQPVLGGA